MAKALEWFWKKSANFGGKGERKPIQRAIMNYLKKVGEAKLTEKYDLKNCNFISYCKM